MQAHSNTQNNKLQQVSDTFPANNTLNYALEAAEKKLAKKTGKPNIGSQPVDPQKFFEDFHKTQLRNQELQYRQKSAREPIKTQPPKPPFPNTNTIPPFSNITQLTQNINNSVKNPSSNVTYSNNSLEPGEIMEKKTDFTSRLMNEGKAQQKLEKALQKSNLSFNPSPGNTAKMANPFVKDELQVVEDVKPMIPTSNSQNSNNSLKSPSLEVKLSSSVSQVQKESNTLNKTVNQTPNTSLLPNSTSSEKPFASIINSQMNPGNVITSKTQVQNSLPLKINPPPNTTTSNNQTSNVNKDSVPTQKAFEINSNNNINNISKNSVNNIGFNNTQNQNSHSTTNPLQTTIKNVNNNAFLQQKQNTQPNIAPNSFNSNNTASNLSQINDESSLSSKTRTRWSQYKKIFQWQQHRSSIVQKMSNKGVVNDQTVDTLAAMTFSAKQPLTLNQIQKNGPKIIKLGMNYQNAKQSQSQLLSQNHQLLIKSEKDRKQIGFNLQGYLGEQNSRNFKDFSMYTQADIQKMLKDQEVMRIYTHFQNKTVGQFLKFYQKQQVISTRKTQQVAKTTIQALRKKITVETLAAEYEIEQKRNKQLKEGAALQKILEKQQKLFRFEEKIQERLSIEDEILPKNELFYELQDLKHIEKEQKRIIGQLHIIKDLLEDAKKGEPYKSVVDIVHNSTYILSDRINSIQNELLPAFEESISQEQ